MLIYVYLLLQIFLQATVAFKPVSFEVKRVEEARPATRDGVSNGSMSGYMGDIMKPNFVEVSVWSKSYAHVITLGVGSTNEVVNVLVDFTSPDLTVLSSDTSFKESSFPGKFNYSQSTTFKRNETFYSSPNGKGTGFWGQDDVTIGNVTVKGLDFGVQNVSNSYIGTLGLGLPEWASTNENASDRYVHENMLMKLKSQGVISKIAYSIFHEPLPYSYFDDGTLLFGAVDHAKYSGNLTTLPMIKQNSTGATTASNTSIDNMFRERHIQVLLHGIKYSVNTEVDGQTMTITNNTYYAAFDPLYGLNHFPNSIVEAMAAALGAEYSTKDSKWIVPCVNGEDVVFLLDFGGVTLRVPLSSFLDVFGSSCMLNVTPLPGLEEVIVLGNNILKHAYLVFDLEDLEVSIAQVKVSKMADIQEIVSKVPRAVKGSTQTTIGSITSEAEVTHLFTYQTIAASELPSLFGSSKSKSVSSTWILVLCGFAFLIMIMYRLYISTIIHK